MAPTFEVLFAPAEFEALPARPLADSICVVFDVLRATSTIVTALASGALAVTPVAEIADALALRRKNPDVLLAGEREGFRIPAGLAGGVEFDLGNSPREFTAERVGGRTIALTTTNGSRALRACAHAGETLAAAFLNLGATADYLRQQPAKNLVVVCSGTHQQAAYEDMLGAGALADLLWTEFGAGASDSAMAAREIFTLHSRDPLAAASRSRNGKRLVSIPELREDVSYCLTRDRFPLIARLQENGAVVKHG